MGAHLLLFAYITILGAVIFRKHPYTAKQNKRFVILAFMGIWLLYSFRTYQVGWDTTRYITSFYRLRNTHNFSSVRYEFLFKVVMFLCGLFSGDYTLFLAATGFLMVYGVGLVICSNLHDDESAFWSVILYLSICLYFNSFNLMRQFVAIAISCNIYTVLNKEQRTRKDYIIACILLVLACFFHRVSVICVSIILIYMIPNITRKHIILILIGTIALSLLIEFALQIFYRLFPVYQVYSLSEKTEGASSLGGQYAIMTIYKVFLVVVCFMLDDHSDDNSELYRLATLVAICIAFTIMRVRVQVALRFSYYFEVFTILLAPKVLNRIKGPRSRMLFKIMTYIMAIGLFILAMQSSHGHRGAVPYVFNWQ